MALVALALIAIPVLRWHAGIGKTPQSNAAPHPSHGTESDSPFVRQIYALIHSGAGGVALKRLAQYHEHHPEKSDLDYLIPYSALLITEGESPKRARSLLEGLLANPTASPQLKSRAHHWLGYLLLSQDEADMGESHFLEALQLNPTDAAARFNLGRAYLKQEKFPQALDYFQLAELAMPDLWLVHIYKGRAKAALGNMNEARTSFKAAIDASPDRWIAYIYYSIFLRGLNDTEGAQSILRRMLTRDPHYELHTPPPWGFFQEPVNYGEYLAAFTAGMDKAQGEDKELGKLYITYLLNGPNSAEGKKLETVAANGALLAKVLGLQATLDREGSLEDIKVAVNRLPANLSDFGYYAYVLRGEGKARLGLLAEAHEDYNHALTLDPRAASAHFQLAGLLRKTQHNSDAENEIRSLLLYHPDYIPAIVPSQNYY
jgi:tetratricopeptide (TPR) repeat protein